MRTIALPLVGFAFVAVLGCGQKNGESPKGTGGSVQSHGAPAAAGQKTTEAPMESGASPVVAQQLPAGPMPNPTDQGKPKPDGDTGKNSDGAKEPAKTEDLRRAIRALLAQRPTTPKTDQAAQERLMKRFPNLPNPDLDAWVEVLAAVTKEQANKGVVRMTVLNLEPLWREDAFQPTVSTQYLARVRQLPEPALARWRSAFGRIEPSYNIGDYPSKAATVLILARQERLFNAERFREDESGRLVGRYETIPRAVVKTWAEAAGGHEIDVAMMLTQLDLLFDEERFQPPVFQKAVAILKEEQ